MPIIFEHQKGTKNIYLRLIGKLERKDYVQFVPEIEQMIAIHGKIRVLMEMRDFHGWEMVALWQDVKFDAKHFKDIERIAMVGDRRWQKWMAEFCKPFTTADIRYFEPSQVNEAEKWIADSEAELAGLSQGKRSTLISDGK